MSASNETTKKTLEEEEEESELFRRVTLVLHLREHCASLCARSWGRRAVRFGRCSFCVSPERLVAVTRLVMIPPAA